MSRYLDNDKPEKFSKDSDYRKTLNKNGSVYCCNNNRRQTSRPTSNCSYFNEGKISIRSLLQNSISPTKQTQSFKTLDPIYIENNSPIESRFYNEHPPDGQTLIIPKLKGSSSSPPRIKIWKKPGTTNNVQTEPNQEQISRNFGPRSPNPQRTGVPRLISTKLKIPLYKSDPENSKLPECNKTTSTKNKFPILKTDMMYHKKDHKTPKLPETVPTMDWKNYHRLNVIDGFMDDMEKMCPSLCTVAIIGRSIEGRDIKLLKVSDSNVTNAAVWIDSGIHAREWIGPAVSTFVANHIVKNFNKLPKYCKNKDWYFLPVINPDGYEYSHTENRMWRKNRACHGGKCVGVDLNRNFSFGWGGKGSSDDPQHNFYRGTAPFSEPEACAVRDVIANAGISFKVYITLHSFGQVIIVPFACQEGLCPNYIHLLQGATAMSKAIFETNGNVYKVGISKDVMYRAAGTSNDWSHGEMGIPYCYLIELRSRKHKFKVPQEEIEETGNEILNSVIALMEHVEKHGYHLQSQIKK